MSKVQFVKASNGELAVFDKSDVISVDETVNRTGTILTFRNRSNVGVISTYESAVSIIFGKEYVEARVAWGDGYRNPFAGRRATRK